MLRALRLLKLMRLVKTSRWGWDGMKMTIDQSMVAWNPKMMVTPNGVTSFSRGPLNTDIHVTCCFAGEIAPAKKMVGRV